MSIADFLPENSLEQITMALTERVLDQVKFMLAHMQFYVGSEVDYDYNDNYSYPTNARIPKKLFLSTDDADQWITEQNEMFFAVHGGDLCSEWQDDRNCDNREDVLIKMNRQNYDTTFHDLLDYAEKHGLYSQQELAPPMAEYRAIKLES